MIKLSPQEEKELLDFIKVWLKAHGYTQKELSKELNIKSSRTSEISKKVKEFYKKGGVFNIAKNLIKVEQNWLNNAQTNSEKKENEVDPYNQLDIDALVSQIKKDSCK